MKDYSITFDKRFDPLQEGRNINLNQTLPLRPQDLEDNIKMLIELEGRKPWVKDQDVPDDYPFDDFENENIGLGCRKPAPQIKTEEEDFDIHEGLICLDDLSQKELSFLYEKFTRKEQEEINQMKVTDPRQVYPRLVAVGRPRAERYYKKQNWKQQLSA